MDAAFGRGGPEENDEKRDRDREGTQAKRAASRRQALGSLCPRECIAVRK